MIVSYTVANGNITKHNTIIESQTSILLERYLVITPQYVELTVI